MAIIHQTTFSTLVNGGSDLEFSVDIHFNFTASGIEIEIEMIKIWDEVGKPLPVPVWLAGMFEADDVLRKSMIQTAVLLAA